ncbi:MAG TPA: sensor domain-containing diguanylate cyclase [Gemmatimonadaceae bacterium]|nr:sensor domain-containing diguanylate cyclase [Gemmatimonadaceae bacterium]
MFPRAPVRAPATAEVLLWQSSVRLVVFGGLIGSFLFFRLLGLSAASAVGVQALGARGAGLAYAVLTTVYVVVVLLARRRLRLRRAAGWSMVLLFVTADLWAIYGALLLVAPPLSYERGLLISFVSLVLTQLYFGRLLAAYVVVLTTVLHVALLAVSAGAGAPVVWIRELWTLEIFLIGAAAYIWIQGSVTSRLTRLVRLFERMEEGDFSLAYDTTRERRPDNVTMVGRAYNSMRAQLASIVLTDPLSGCLNRRGFEQELARELARCGRSGTPLALLALDVDHFKRINDTFGHLAGDVVIAEVGELLRDCARAGDVVARVGGEEFMLLAPDTNIAGAYHLATRVADSFRARRFRGVEGRLPITASVGVVAEDAPSEAITGELRARADEALYAAKRGGRNRVVVWAEGGAGAPPGRD